jgi:hypothetical protein
MRILRPSAVVSVSLPALGLALASALAPAARGQATLLKLETPIAGSMYGNWLAGIGDVSGDGVPDLAIGAPEFSVFASGSKGRVEVISGADGALIASIAGTSFLGYFGQRVEAAGDVDADGVPDLLVGEPGYTTDGGLEVGAVWVYSGADWSVIRLYDGLSFPAQIGGGFCSAGDANADGHADAAIFVGHATTLYIMSGLDGTVLHVRGDVAQPCNGSQDPMPMAPIGDANGDGFDDMMIGCSALTSGAGHIGAAWAISGRDGEDLFVLLGPTSSSFLGEGVAGAGDLDGDGHPDVLVSSNETIAHVWAFSGADGSLLQTLTAAPGETNFGNKLAGPGDVNGDGVPDIALTVGGAVPVVSGADGSRIMTLKGIGTTSMCALGDVDGDGRSDIAVGTPVFGPDGKTGHVFVFSTQPWKLLGHALAGGSGAPQLAGQGTLKAGTPVTLQLSGALPGGQATLVAGTTQLAAPFKGGVLVPFPDILVFGLPISPAGASNLTVTWPPNVPAGTTVSFQMWIADPGGPSGFAASNGLSGTQP